MAFDFYPHLAPGTGATGADPGRPASAEVLWEFISAATWHVSRWTLEQHPELLSDATDRDLAGVIAVARAKGETAKAQEFDRHLTLLRHCRTIGMDAAFEEVSEDPVVPLSLPMQSVIDEAAAADARYRATGDVQTLDADVQALVAATQAVEADLAVAPLRSWQEVLGSVGSVVLQRGLATGRPGDLRSDLEAVLWFWEKALASAPHGIDDLTASFSNLGGHALLLKFALTNDLTDVDRAVQAFEHAIAATPADSPDRPGILSNLDRALMARYQQSRDPRDLMRATAARQRR